MRILAILFALTLLVPLTPAAPAPPTVEVEVRIHSHGRSHYTSERVVIDLGTEEMRRPDGNRERVQMTPLVKTVLGAVHRNSAGVTVFIERIDEAPYQWWVSHIEVSGR